ncbi:hypothetical protein ACEPAG_2262 [Sanghuangporus baumii]
MLSTAPTLHGLPAISVRDAKTSAAITFELGDQLASYFGMAATCLLTYDIITTIDKEVHLFWKARNNFTTWVFFLNRYIGFYAASINTIYFLNPHRAFGAWSHQLAGWFGIVMIDCILLMRVLALCPGDKKLARFLMALFAAESIASFGLLLHIEIIYHPGNIHVLNRVYCGIRGHFDKQSATGYWILPLIFEIVLLGVAVHKSITYWGSFKELGRFKLASILLRDQIIYFIIVMACSVGSITVYWIDDSNFQAVVSGFANASLPCVLGSHLLFNLKEAALKSPTDSTDLGTLTVSDVRFN